MAFSNSSRKKTTLRPVEIKTTEQWYDRVNEIYANALTMHDTGTNDHDLMRYLFKSIETLRAHMNEDLSDE